MTESDLRRVVRSHLERAEFITQQSASVSRTRKSDILFTLEAGRWRAVARYLLEEYGRLWGWYEALASVPHREASGELRTAARVVERYIDSVHTEEEAARYEVAKLVAALEASR